MSKVKIKMTLKTSQEMIEKELLALWKEEEQRIIYQEDEILKTKVIYDYKRNILIRENDQIHMNYIFELGKETTGKIKVKELQQEVNVQIKTNKLQKKHKNITIEFFVEKSPIEYKIEVI